jgi:hypothetical protein
VIQARRKPRERDPREGDGRVRSNSENSQHRVAPAPAWDTIRTKMKPAEEISNNQRRVEIQCSHRSPPEMCRPSFHRVPHCSAPHPNSPQTRQLLVVLFHTPPGIREARLLLRLEATQREMGASGVPDALKQRSTSAPPTLRAGPKKHVCFFQRRGNRRLGNLRTGKGELVISDWTSDG